MSCSPSVVWKSSKHSVQQTSSGSASFPVPKGSPGPMSLHNHNHVLISRSPKSLFKTLEISIYLTLRPQTNQLLGRGTFSFIFSSRTLQVIRLYSTSSDQLFGIDVWEQALLLECSTGSILGHKASKKIFRMKRIHVFLALYLQIYNYFFSKESLSKPQESLIHYTGCVSGKIHAYHFWTSH